MLITLCRANAARPTIPGVRISEPPKIDGDLSDSCWKSAPSVTDYYSTSDASRFSETTTTWLCYDKKNIYIAFDCKDSQPDKIVVQQCKRGGNIDCDDWVGLDLDCYNNSEHIAWFDVSAGGVQVESLESGDVSKIEWKGDWKAAARRTNDGYTVEIAIPFSILQYDCSHTNMGIAFIRRHSRTNQWWWSPSVGPDKDPRRFYLWEGLQLPELKNRPTIMAYSMIGGGASNATGRGGLDMKYAVTPSLTGSLTMNPDFHDIEQSINSTDFSYNEKYQSDTRPFFAEGQKYLPWHEQLYTRRISAIDYGAKVSGKLGDYGLGFVHGSKPGSLDFTAARVGRLWPGRFGFDVSSVLSNQPGEQNESHEIATDFVLRDVRGRKTDFYANYAAAGPTSSLGNMYDFKINTAGAPKSAGWSIERHIVDSNYNPYLGYVPEKDIQTWQASIWLWDEPSKGKFKEWDVWTDLNAVNHKDGSLYYNDMDLNASYYWRSGSTLDLTAYGGHRPPYDDRQIAARYWWGGRSLFRNGNVRVCRGKMAGGNYTSYSLLQGWDCLKGKLNSSLSWGHSTISQPSPEAYSSDQLITSVNYDIDREHSVAGRLVLNGGKNNIFFSYRQRVRSGVDIWAIFGDPNAESTTNSFAIKMVRML